MRNQLPIRAIKWACFSTLLLVALLPEMDWSGFTEQTPFVIGEATAKNVSINGRIASFYAQLLCNLSVFTLVFYGIKKWNATLENHPYITWIDGFLVLGIGCGMLHFFHMEITHTLLFCGASSLVLVALGYVKNRPQIWCIPEFWVAIGFVFLGNYALFHSAIIGFIFAIGAIWLGSLFTVRWRFALFMTLLTLPIAILIGVELAFIFNQRCISIPSIILVILPIILIVFGFFFWIKTTLSIENTLPFYQQIFPLGLVSIAFLQCYTPIINQPTELFEYANKMNPVMQLIHFGEIPLIDNLSSHLVSDFFWEMTYTLLNGAQQDASILIYSELTHIALILSIYYYLKAQFGNHPWIVLILLLSPFIFVILPLYYALCLIPITRLIHLANNFSSRNLHAFYLTICALCIWRIDLGVSLVSALIILVPFWWMAFSDQRKLLVRITSYYVVTGGLLFASMLAFFPGQLSQMKAYFGANQVHGISVLTYTENTEFYVNYYILPLLVLLISAYSLFQLVQKNTDKHHLPLLFIGGFYLFNLQRGLVRHSFAENNETQIASFGWLVVALTIVQFLISPKNRVFFIALFSTLIGVFVSIHSPSESLNLFERDAKLSLKDLPYLRYSKIQRIVPSVEFDQSTQPIISFLKNELKKGETFIDFSNNPMLYYYTQKNVPSYFNQYLQNTVTDPLQRMNLSMLKKMNIPFVVFEKNPISFFDQLDGIPNKIRYHLITAFIYKRYVPWKQIGGFCVWKLKSTHQGTNNELLSIDETWDLGWIPYYWKKAEPTHPFVTSHEKIGVNNIQQTMYWKQIVPGAFAECWISSSTEQTIVFKSTHFQLSFLVKNGRHRYRIPLGCSENLIQPTSSFLNYESAYPIQIENTHFVKLKP